MGFDWNAVWERKGSSESQNHQEISGFEHLQINAKDVAKNLTKILDIGPSDTVLEIGCAAGLVAHHLNIGTRYVGIDKVPAMIDKIIKLNGLSALRCDATDLLFKDKSFDKVFSFGVFHYFPTHDYAWRAVNEMIRVAKHTVLIADLPRISHDSNHLLFSESMFTETGWKLSEAIFFRPERFDVIKHF